MENEELENIDSQNDDQENIDSSNDNEELDSEDESNEQPEYTDNEKQLYARMKKAEKELKEAKEAGLKKPAPKKKADDTGLSTTDIIALSKADIDDEDIDEVLDYAKYKGISVKEALNSSILKSTIAEAAEQRKSAQAVNTGSTRRAGGQVSDDRLLADARKGIMPDKDSDMERLALLRFKNK